MAENAQPLSTKLDCRECGAVLKYQPGKEALMCDYCGTETQVPQSEDIGYVNEVDYRKFLKNNSAAEMTEVVTVSCKNCGASTSLNPNVTADSCVFCASPLVVEGATTSRLIKPAYLLPFHVEDRAAFEYLTTWGRSQWFAPNDLKKHVAQANKLSGIYMPYWTFDCETESNYEGERGDDYTVHDKEGKPHTKTRWTYVTGSVECSFDDTLIVASYSLAENYANELAPWDLENLVPYRDEYLSGFRCESYQVDIETAFEQAKKRMDDFIEDEVDSDIGGDHQRVDTINTAYNNITFKHILLPVWLSTYTYKDKVYTCMINARTGEVQGERPDSWIKIFFAIISGIGIIYGIYQLLVNYR